MLSPRVRALFFASLLAPTLACSDGSFSAAESNRPESAAALPNGREGQTAQALSVADAGGKAVHLDYLAEFMTDCRDIEGKAGRWAAVAKQLPVCAAEIGSVAFCAFHWSPAGEAPPEVDVLAAGVGRYVRNLKDSARVGGCVPTSRSRGHGQVPGTNGSTPCGACQVGFATPTNVYLSLGAPFDRDTAYQVHLGSIWQPPLVIQVPAHQTFVSLAIALPGVPEQGVPLIDPKLNLD